MPQADGVAVNTTSNSVKTGLVFDKNTSEAAIALDRVLKLLREARDEVMRPAKTGGRELSEAITCIETGCMWMNRAKFADTPYTPVLTKKE